jgi:small redox-active disulfide protein 2
MKIQVLGSGCRKCVQLYENVKAAMDEVSLDAELEKVEDPDTITDMGVLITPALLVDGKVHKKGRVPSADELIELFEEMSS